jgi:hypothetical protein
LKQYGKIGTSAITQNKQINQTESSELILLQIFSTLYGPKKLLLDEGMILWKGQQKNRANNSDKMVKYHLPVKML